MQTQEIPVLVNEGKQLFCQKLAVHGAAGVIEVLMRIAGAEYQLRENNMCSAFCNAGHSLLGVAALPW